ncbi:MAG: flagellar protein FlaG [Methylophilaceae bacterium]
MSAEHVSLMTGRSGLLSGLVSGQPALPHQVSSVENPEIEVKKMEVTPDVLQKMIDEANQMLSYIRPDIKFVIDEGSKKVVIMLIEPDTGDVINRFPTEQALAISHAITQSHEKVAARHEAFRHAGDGVLGLLVRQRT